MPSPCWLSSVVGSGLQHPGAPRGARDAEPGRVPGVRYSKLLAASSTLGSTPARPDTTFPAASLAKQGSEVSKEWSSQLVGYELPEAGFDAVTNFVTARST